MVLPGGFENAWNNLTILPTRGTEFNAASSAPRASDVDWKRTA